MKHKQRELVDKATEEVAFADKVMWSGIRRKHPALPKGCKTLLLELFCGAMVMTAVAATHPLSRLYPVSQPTDYILDELDMTNPDHRTIIDRQIDEDDPYLTTIAFNCGPWNPLTRFNMARNESTRTEYMRIREENRPMLKWICDLSCRRMRRGRLVLIEQGWLCDSLDQPEFEALYTAEDGVTGEPFEFIKADQCMLGQVDKESGIPMKASTAIGTASRALKDSLGVLCDGSHDHQPVCGRNVYGNRSAQKSIWPAKMCKKIIEATIRDMEDKTDMVAYPAVHREEQREEEGPIDDPEDPMTRTAGTDPDPPVGTELPEAEEQEQEFLD